MKICAFYDNLNVLDPFCEQKTSYEDVAVRSVLGNWLTSWFRKRFSSTGAGLSALLHKNSTNRVNEEDCKIL